jgi:hypothetical protein
MSGQPKRGALLDLEINRMNKELEDLKQAKEKQEKQKKEEFTLAQQMLILHYLGFIKEIDLVNTKKSLLLSKLIKGDKNNIRNMLTYISSQKLSYCKIKNRENLGILVELFDKIGMSEVADRINIDISKLKEE